MKDRWIEIVPGLWIIRGNRWDGSSIWETKNCEGCSFRATTDTESEKWAFCLFGAIKILSPRPPEKRRKCTKDFNTINPADPKSWVSGSVYFSPDRVPYKFYKEGWQWLLPGFHQIMGEMGRAKSKGRKMINFLAPKNIK